MKNKLQLALLITSFSLLLFSACKKSANDITKLDFTEESTTHSDDQSTFTNETDALANDFNTIVDNYVALNGREANTLAIPCDATVTVDSISSPRRITITYNGSNCVPFRTRTGTVVITMPANVRWRDSGAIMTVNMQNVKITRTGNNRSITINGIKTIRNVTGGLIRQVVMPGVTVVHEIRSNNMSVRFADSTSRTWQIARRRGFTFNNGLTITTRGIATVDGINEVAEWGTNRYGNEFITATTEPLIVRQNCGFRLTSGQVKHHKMASLVTVTFGLDSTGAPTTCPMNAPFYFKMVYTGANNVTRTVIRPYN